MNQEGEQVNYSKCEFIPTEVNHDLHGVVGKNLNLQYQKQGLITTNLDNNNTTGCINPQIMIDLRPRGKNVYDDYETTLLITGYDPDGFKVLDSQDQNHITTIQMNPLTKPETNVNNISTRIPNGATCKKLTKQYYSNFYRLFDDIEIFNDTANGVTQERNIYLVIDTGDDLVKKLGQSLQGQAEFNYNIHVIHSLLTLADSAKKTRPDSKNYTTPYRHLNQYSWLYNVVPDTIGPNNSIFMSNYQITNNFNQGSFDWKIRQTWNLPPFNVNRNPVYETYNAHVDNNKTVVTKEIIEGQENNNDNAINLAFQKKRSGDHLQILAAKELPVLLNNNPPANFIQVRTNNQNQHTLVGKGENYYRRNLFFVTGDWPAFSYAIYNRINSIIMIRTPNMETSFTLVVMFNQNV
jgi:hypothetical protein